MAKIVAVFNTATGLNLTELQGWAFMQALKYVRLYGSIDFYEDSAIDMIAYSALAAECGAINKGDNEPMHPVEKNANYQAFYGVEEKDLKPCTADKAEEQQSLHGFKIGQRVGFYGFLKGHEGKIIAFYSDERVCVELQSGCYAFHYSQLIPTEELESAE